MLRRATRDGGEGGDRVRAAIAWPDLPWRFCVRYARPTASDESGERVERATTNVEWTEGVECESADRGERDHAQKAQGGGK